MSDRCDHTMHLYDAAGRRQGSWIDEAVHDPQFGPRVRVVCGVCGKFYGYLIRSRAEAEYVRSRHTEQPEKRATDDPPAPPPRQD